MCLRPGAVVRGVGVNGVVGSVREYSFPLTPEGKWMERANERSKTARREQRRILTKPVHQSEPKTAFTGTINASAFRKQCGVTGLSIKRSGSITFQLALILCATPSTNEPPPLICFCRNLGAAIKTTKVMESVNLKHGPKCLNNEHQQNLATGKHACKGSDVIIRYAPLIM